MGNHNSAKHAESRWYLNTSQPYLNHLSAVSDNSHCNDDIDEDNDDADDVTLFSREAALTIFCLLYQMMPVPYDAWVPRTQFHDCMICSRKLGRISFSYSHCRKCGMILCRTCAKQRFRFPHLPLPQQKVCSWCFGALSTMDTKLSRTLQSSPWSCSRTDLLSLINENLFTKSDETDIRAGGGLKTNVKSVSPIDAFRHAVAELFKTSASGAEAVATRSGAQMFFAGGTAPLAAAGSAVIVVQVCFTSYEVYRLCQRFNRGRLNADEHGWGITAESSKGVFSIGGATSGAVAGSVIPGLGTVLGACLGAVVSFAAGSTAHSAVRVLGSFIVRKRALTRPTMELLSALIDGCDSFMHVVQEQLEFACVLRIRPMSLDLPLRTRIDRLEQTVKRLGLWHRTTKAELKRVCRQMDAKLDYKKKHSSSVRSYNSKYNTNHHQLMQLYSNLVFQFLSMDYRCEEEAILVQANRIRSVSSNADIHRDKDYCQVVAVFERDNDAAVQRSRQYIKRQYEELALCVSPQKKTRCLQNIVDCCATLLTENGTTPGAEAVNDALLYSILEFQPKSLYTTIQFISEMMRDTAIGKTAFVISSVHVVVGSLADGKIN